MARSFVDRSMRIRSIWAVLAMTSVFLIAACSTPDPTPTPIPSVPPTATSVPTATQVTQPEANNVGGLEEPEEEWIIRTESDELNLILATPDLAPGTRRFAMVLTDGSGIVAFPVVKVESFRYPGGIDSLDDRDGPIESARARYYPFPYGTRGIHVTELTFDTVGTWGVEASIPRPDGSVAKIEVITEVHEETMSVDVGEVPPLSQSRTINDVFHVSELTTGSSRYEDLYQVSIADALQNDKPTVVVFASPAFCTNAVCGPQVEVLSNLSKAYPGQADFVHIDLFTNPQEIQGDLTRANPSPLLQEWGLVSQEWTFVMDGDGRVTGRFENFVPEEELEPSLLSVLDLESVETTGGSEMLPSSPTPETPGAIVQEEAMQGSEDAGGPPATSSEGGELVVFEIDSETTWREPFDQLSESEQQCVRDEIEVDQLESFLNQRIAEDGETDTSASKFGLCLDPRTLEAFYLSLTLGTMGDQVSPAGVVCIQDLISNSDLQSIIAGEEPGAHTEDIAAAGEYFGGMMACSIADQLGGIETMTEDQRCVADLFDETDFSAVYIGGRPDASSEAAAEFEAFVGELFGCMAGIMESGIQQAGNGLPAQ